MKHEVRQLKFVANDLDSGNIICPACPTRDAKVCFTLYLKALSFIAICKNRRRQSYSMDGLFGLPRKKSAGKSHRPSLHGHLFFEDLC